jgi:ABC-2 type transport system ATP-binding protein
MENLLYAGRLYGLGSHETQTRGQEILDSLGISKKVASEPMEHMSRGMQQKVAISRALLTAPVLLLLDEPTTGLDPRSKKDVQRMVLALRQEHDATIVLTTHDMDEADRLCDRLGVLDKGRVIALDTPAHLKQAGGSLEDVFMRLTDEEAEDAA